MEHRDVLMAIAQVAATFIGFASVVFAVGRASVAGVNAPERTALIHLLLPSILVLFLAFAPVVAFAGITSEAQVWRVANGVLGIIHLLLVSNATWVAVRSQLLEPVPLRFVLIPGGYLAVAANLAVTFGFLQELAVLIYLAGLVWFLLVAAVQFVMLILLHERVT
jgi:hypothetical protein